MNDHPTWFIETGKTFWKNRISPFGFARLIGQRNALEIFKGFVERKWTPSMTVKPEMVDTITDYLYQVYMRDGTTEYSPMVHLTPQLKAYIPLGTSDKLLSNTFPLPVSFIYGSYDWV